MPSLSHPEHGHHHHSLRALTLAALGVVYGDIGTSPLYAFRECFSGSHVTAPTHDNVLGVLSLMLWALIIVVTLMYVTLMLRADNRGEGGIMALMVLTLSALAPERRRYKLGIVMLGLFGASLLMGEGMITPSITVLGAVEGLQAISPKFSDYVIPIALVALFLLFRFQKHGSGKLGNIFGPIIMIWFIVMAVLGVASVVQNPEVLMAVNPLYGLRFLLNNGFHGFLVLGAVFLVCTGGESLYADMGHFGAKPIRLGWYGLVLPSLLMNYFGQGALYLRMEKAGLLPDAAGAGVEESTFNPFFGLAPDWALIPLVILATIAAVIASQAVISGVFSMVRQAVLLGYLPRMHIVHTSASVMGQIYVPVANGLLMIATMGLVIGFGSSSALAAAYGVAVTTTMLFTTLLLGVVAVKRWHWPLALAIAVCGLFFLFNGSFTVAAYMKIPVGGWFPLFIGICVYLIMHTWRRGRARVRERLGTMTTLPLDLFTKNVTEGSHQATRVPGTAIYLYSADEGTPRALLHNLRYNKVLHEQVLVLTVKIEEKPHVRRENRIEISEVGNGVYRIFAHYGFMESPDLPEIMKLCAEKGLKVEMHTAVYVLARENIKSRQYKGLGRWEQGIFLFLSRNAHEASSFFNIPANQVVELGIQVEV